MGFNSGFKGLNVMAHGDTREGKWRWNWRMEWVASILHTTSEHGVSSITTADAHTSVVSSRLNWRPCRFKWTRPFRRKMKYGFCTCAITFQTQFIQLLPTLRNIPEEWRPRLNFKGNLIFSRNWASYTGNVYTVKIQQTKILCIVRFVLNVCESEFIEPRW